MTSTGLVPPALLPPEPGRRDLTAATGSTALAVVVLLVALVVVLAAVPYLRQKPLPMQSAPGRAVPGHTGAHAVAAAIAPAAQVQADFAALRTAIEAYRDREGRIPADDSELRQAWHDRYPVQAFPIDPYNGQSYAYRTTEGEYSLTSAGPNLHFSSAGQ